MDDKKKDAPPPPGQGQQEDAPVDDGPLGEVKGFRCGAGVCSIRGARESTSFPCTRVGG